MFGPQSADPQLEGLIEIALPQAISYKPETIGWLILFSLIITLLVWIVYRRYRHIKANRYRRWALEKLQDIERILRQNLGLEKALAEIPVLVKQTALHCFPREKIASLSGENWLRFLDASYGGTDFTDGPGQILEQTAYQPSKRLEQYKEEEIHDLIHIVRKWIKKHRRES
ncbi:MAG: DUF4381 family protein [Candidatus Aminicenantes bacterium]|nr:DUF4381 family protein [Candidatus Aminicenantes bacterium]